jgi:hypothetical protein
MFDREVVLWHYRPEQMNVVRKRRVYPSASERRPMSPEFTKCDQVPLESTYIYVLGSHVEFEQNVPDPRYTLAVLAVKPLMLRYETHSVVP